MKTVYKVGGMSHLQFATEELALEAAQLMEIQTTQIEAIPVFESLEESKTVQQYLARLKEEKKQLMGKIKAYNDNRKEKAKPKPKKKSGKKKK